MQKIIIVGFVILAGYLVYSNVSTEEVKSDQTETIEEVKAPKVQKSIVKTEENPFQDEYKDLTAEDYIGLYSQERITNDFAATLEVEILDEKQYRHKRIINRDSVVKQGEVVGEYNILVDGSIELIYPESRDKSIFSTPKALFKLDDDKNLVSGDWTLSKQ